VGIGNNYFYLTAACRDYGITIGTHESPKIELTALGRIIVYPNFHNAIKNIMVNQLL
jgi:hypothetical protein